MESICFLGESKNKEGIVKGKRRQHHFDMWLNKCQMRRLGPGPCGSICTRRRSLFSFTALPRCLCPLCCCSWLSCCGLLPSNQMEHHIRQQAAERREQHATELNTTQKQRKTKQNKWKLPKTKQKQHNTSLPCYLLIKIGTAAGTTTTTIITTTTTIAKRGEEEEQNLGICMNRTFERQMQNAFSMWPSLKTGQVRQDLNITFMAIRDLGISMQA